MNIEKITDSYYASDQLTQADMAEIARLGIKSIICNRPDGEKEGQPDFAEIEKSAAEVGIVARHNPIPPAPPSREDADKQALALNELDGPVLAFCGTGKRAVNLWKMVEST